MTPRTVWLLGAAIFGAGALAFAGLLFVWEWVPRVDFDLIGFLWILTNLPGLFVLAGLMFAGSFAVYCLLRAARS